MRREQTVRDEALSSCGEYNEYFQGNSAEYRAVWRALIEYRVSNGG